MPNYWLPVREPIPEFRYDLAVWCEYLLAVVGPSFPPYLKEFEERVRAFAAEKETVRPESFRDGFRVYVFDHRLGVHLALFDPTGKTAEWCYLFAKGNHRPVQYVYGDGELIGPQLPGDPWDHDFLRKFIRRYGFAPIDELGESWLVIFEDDSLHTRTPLAPWQVAFLLMKFRNKTLIDWREILNDPRYR